MCVCVCVCVCVMGRLSFTDSPSIPHWLLCNWICSQWSSDCVQSLSYTLLYVCVCVPVPLLFPAVDNQLYVAVCSPARDPDASYVAWGHSMVVDPWCVNAWHIFVLLGGAT